MTLGRLRATLGVISTQKTRQTSLPSSLNALLPVSSLQKPSPPPSLLLPLNITLQACPGLLSVAVIDMIPRTAWGEKGLFGLPVPIDHS